MELVKREDLQEATIDELKGLLDNTIYRIVETKKLLKTLSENKKVYESELIKKEKIKTTNIIKIQKHRNRYSSTTDIDICLDKVDKNGSLIEEVDFRRLKYNERSLLFVELATLYEKYRFEEIITNMKLTKAISEKYKVKFVETMKR